MSTSIILATANARYSHSSLGLRYLFANLDQDLRDKSLILESTINQTAASIVNEWIKFSPQIIGIGIYIWNLDILTEAISLLKRELPQNSNYHWRP